MSNDLLSTLGEKIQNAVETIELLRLEVSELKEENARLLEEKEEWDSKLTALIEQFESLDEDHESDEDEDLEEQTAVAEYDEDMDEDEDFEEDEEEEDVEEDEEEEFEAEALSA